MSPKTKQLDFEKICRTCLSEKNDLKPLFDAQAHLANMLMSCAFIKVDEKDDLPSQICVTCFHQVSRSYAFKLKVEKSDAQLRRYLEQNRRKNDKSIEKNDSKLRRLLEKRKDKNIIEQAATNADIDISTDRNYESEQESDEEDPKITEKTTPRVAKLKANEKIESVFTDEKYDLKSENHLKVKPLDKLKPDSKDEVQIVTQLICDGPPPLVPLIPIPPEQIPDFPAETNPAPAEQALKPISDETPPLVPIKPLETETCQNCEMEFPNATELRKHIATAHAVGKNLSCNICKKEFSERKRLIGHLKGHMVVKQYACKLCGKRYPNPSTFRVHMRTHTGERPFKCAECGKGFVRWAGVVGHMRSHNSTKPFTCDQCGKGFKVASNLERHKVLHSGAMPYCCSYCGKTFSQRDNFQLHVRTYHTHERPYLCSVCGKGYVSATRLNRHMWVHSGHKPYVCQACGKAYSNSNDLKNHTKVHSGNLTDADKPFVCVACNMRFFHACRLAKHMKTHEKPFGCPECLKTFGREDILHKHIGSKHRGLGIVAHTQPENFPDNNIFNITEY